MSCILSHYTVRQCENKDHKTHAFDLNGALSAYLLFMLTIAYAIDSFLKYKDWKFLKRESQPEHIENTEGIFTIEVIL